MHRILTESGNNGQLNAVGVEFKHENIIRTARVRREVILSAGYEYSHHAIFSTPSLTIARRTRALKSAQVLELSGIGRKEVLDKMGIPQVLNLPGVGENVQDHIGSALTWGQSHPLILIAEHTDVSLTQS